MALSGKSRRLIAQAAVGLALSMTVPLMPGAPVQVATERPLTSLRAIRALSNSQASHQLPVLV